MASGIVESSNQGSSSQQQGAGKRSKLVERLLDASANLPAFMKDLLGTMAVTVAGTEAAGFLIERSEAEQSGLRVITHIRPDDSDDDVRAAAIKAFTEIIVPCIQQNKDGAIEVGTPDEGEPQFCLVTMLRNEGSAVAVAAVITRCVHEGRDPAPTAAIIDSQSVRGADTVPGVSRGYDAGNHAGWVVMRGSSFRAVVAQVCPGVAGERRSW